MILANFGPFVQSFMLIVTVGEMWSVCVECRYFYHEKYKLLNLGRELLSTSPNSKMLQLFL